MGRIVQLFIGTICTLGNLLLFLTGQGWFFLVLATITAFLIVLPALVAAGNPWAYGRAMRSLREDKD
jgi:hypothetical protein